MPLKNVLTSAILILIPILGLMSCSKDRPQDNWALSEPTIESATRTSMPLKSTNFQNLPGDSRLVLSATDGAKPALTVEAICKSGDRVSKGRVVSKDSSNISLRDLWPEEFWRTLNANELKSSSCDFDFTAESETGSTHSFKMQNVSLDDFTYSADPTQKNKSNGRLQLESSTIQTAAPFSAFGAPSASTVDPAQLNFICDNFTTNLSITDFGVSNSERNVLKEITEKPIEAKNGADPRDEKAVQSCRLLRIEKDAESGVPHYILSSSFMFTFPAPRLEIQSSFDLRSTSVYTWAAQKIFTVTLKNMSGVTTAVQVPKDFGRVHIRLVGYTGENAEEAAFYAIPAFSYYVGSRVIDEQLISKISGDGTPLANGEFWVYEIAPGATLTIQTRIAPKDMCGKMSATSDSTDMNKSGWAGLLYSYTKAIAIEQFGNWNAARTLTGERINLNLIEGGLSPIAEPNIFAPSDAYLATGDRLGRQPSIPYKVGPSLPRHFMLFDTCWFADAENLLAYVP